MNVPGPALGAKVLLRPSATAKSGIDNVYITQVAFKNKNEEEWRWYTAEDLNWGIVQTLEVGSVMRLLATSPAEEEQIRSRLQELGLGPTKTISREKIPPLPEMKTRVTCIFDFNMSRCVAKIAFNYLANALEENTQLLLRPEFDPVRDYVRHGLNPEEPIVYFSEKPQLEDHGAYPLVDGHILAMGWDTAAETLVCRLSLFNAMRYQVVLCRKYRGVWFPVSSAHIFDFEVNDAKKVPLGFLNSVIS